MKLRNYLFMFTVKLETNKLECVNYDAKFQNFSVKDKVIPESLFLHDINKECFSSFDNKTLSKIFVWLKKSSKEKITNEVFSLLKRKLREKQTEEALVPSLMSFSIKEHQMKSFKKELLSPSLGNSIDQENTKLSRAIELLELDRLNLFLEKLTTIDKSFINEESNCNIQKINRVYDNQINNIRHKLNDSISLNEKSRNLMDTKLDKSQSDHDLIRNVDQLPTQQKSHHQSIGLSTPLSNLHYPLENNLVKRLSFEKKREELDVASNLPLYQKNILLANSMNNSEEKLPLREAKFPFHGNMETEPTLIVQTEKRVSRSFIYTFKQWQKNSSVAFSFSEYDNKLLAMTVNSDVYDALCKNRHLLHCEKPLLIRYEDRWKQRHQHEQEDE